MENIIGEFGRWQFRVSTCMALLKLPMAWFQLGIIFLAPPTTYWCRKPEDFREYPLEKWLAYIKPFGNESEYQNTMEGCLMRNIELPKDRSLQICKWGFDYDRSTIESSIITEWNLICNREHYVDLTQSVLMFGVLIGNLLFGSLSDKHGRKSVLIVCIILQSVCGLFSAWSPWIEGFLLMRFLMAVANGGTMIASFVMCMEIVGGKWRTIVPILYQIPFGLGNVIMASVAYYYRTWRHFQIGLSLISALFIVYYWIIPESPRWLMATGQKKRALKVLQSAAKENNIDVTDVKMKLAKEFPKKQRQNEDRGVQMLLRNKTLRVRSFLLITNWLLCGVTLYGFTQYLGHLGTNIYINVSIGGLIIMPGTLLCVFIVNRCGRRYTILVSNIFVACCFFSILLVPRNMFVNDWPKTFFAALGVVGLSISTPALYLYTGESYPTVARNSGLGLSVMFSRIGSMISPFVVSLTQFGDYMPLLVLGICALLQGLLVLPLDESGDSLADTIGDIEMDSLHKNDQIEQNKSLAVIT